MGESDFFIYIYIFPFFNSIMWPLIILEYLTISGHIRVAANSLVLAATLDSVNKKIAADKIIFSGYQVRRYKTIISGESKKWPLIVFSIGLLAAKITLLAAKFAGS
jgi:hypothetical protein